MAKDQIGKVGGKYGPGAEYDPGLKLKAQNDGALEAAKGGLVSKEDKGLLEKREDSKVKKHGNALPERAGENGLLTKNSYL